jgi:hypothetical protein
VVNVRDRRISQPGSAHAAVDPDGWLKRLVRAKAANVVVAGIVCVTVALHVVWLVRFRRGYVTEWDESGYLQFALSNFDALHDEGLWTFAKTVGGRETYGPLLPLLTSLAYPFVGRGIFGSLLVLPVFFAGLVAASFALARRFISDWWAVVAALAVAAIPAVTDYTRLYHFALPATACMTASLWALMRSDALRLTRWALAFGVFAGLMLLSRTMSLAYVPGLALAAGAQFLVPNRDVRPMVRNLFLAAGAVAAVAGTWYVRNARSIYEDLVRGGYGEGATRYGAHYPVFSWGYWTKELRLDLSYIWLPLGVVLLLSFVLGLAYFVSRSPIRMSRLRSRPAAGVVALILVVLEGYLVTTSSRNEGTAFSLPWLPVLVILGVMAAASVPIPSVRRSLAAMLVAVSVAALASKSSWIEPLAKPRTTSVPGLGAVTVTDGRGIIQLELAGNGYDVQELGPTERLPAMDRQWLPLAHEVVGWSLRRAEQRGQPLHLRLGLDDRIFYWRSTTCARTSAATRSRRTGGSCCRPSPSMRSSSATRHRFRR